MPSDRTRASDTERERVVVRLRDAAAAGRLTIDELDERSERAYGSTTRGELAELLDDLPVPRDERATLRDDPPASRGLADRSVADPPVSRAARPSPPRKRRLPWLPGRLAFRAGWCGPSDPRKASADILELLVPVFFKQGYDLVDRTPDRMVLLRRFQPGWTILVSIIAFPIGLIALLARADERITIDLSPRDGYTLTIVQGRAPLRLRRALARLED